MVANWNRTDIEVAARFKSIATTGIAYPALIYRRRWRLIFLVRLQGSLKDADQLSWKGNTS
jgi:hypothetical protein